MFAYRHRFHAGNHADVMKHVLLARLLASLARKDTPYCYVDTHAGVGCYALDHPWSAKNAEHADGVARVWQRADAPPLLEPWLSVVRSLNPDGHLRVYPGSPEIARRLRRPIDRMVLSEFNEDDHAALREHLAGERRLSVLCQDGYQTLRSTLPPAERRGLVLLDSSFDRPGEFARVADALTQAHRRFATGILVIWYPLMDPAAMRRFERTVRDSGVRRVLQAELSVHPADWQGSLRGSGLLVVNPPWGFEGEAREVLDWLAQALAQTQGSSRVHWLVPE